MSQTVLKTDLKKYWAVNNIWTMPIRLNVGQYIIMISLLGLVLKSTRKIFVIFSLEFIYGLVITAS